MSRLDEILNFLPLSDRVGTAGQPTAEQLDAVRKAGYEVVINLAMPTSDRALPDEARIVEELGMSYLPLPVVWDAPTPEDADRFFAAMETRRDRKVFIHCAMNMRVSAFMYLYRTLFEGVPKDEALKDMQRIWTPNETWQGLIRDVAEKKRTTAEGKP